MVLPKRLLSCLVWTFAVLPLGPGAWSQTAPPSSPPGVDLSKPLTLADAARIALQTNPDLTKTAQQILQAQATAARTRSAELPNVQLAWDWSQTRTPDSISSSAFISRQGTNTARDLQVGVTQKLFQSGLHEQVEAAKSAVTAAGFSLADAKRIVVNNVAQNYYTALAATGLAEVAHQAVTDSEQHLQLVQARIATGTAAQVDRYPFDVELAQAQLQAITADNQVSLALNALKRAMGLPATTVISLAGQPKRPAPPAKPESLLATAYASRPDVKELQAQIQSAQFSLKAAKLQRGPTLNLGGSYNYGRHTTTQGEGWQLLASVSVPIFDGGLTKAGVDSATATMRSAEESLRQIQLNLSNDVQNGYLTAVEANARIDASAAAEHSAQVSRDAAVEKYTAGVGTVIEVTDAETKLRQAQADHVKAIYDYNSAMAALRAATGQSAVEGAY